MIERKTLTDLIRQNIIAISKAHTNIFGGYNIIVGDEEVIYKKAEEQNPKTICIAISYSSGNFIYEFGSQSFILNVVSDMNAGQAIAPIYTDYSVAWQLLELYYQSYNLTTATLSDNSVVKQTYNTPVNFANFEEIGSGLRSLISMSGTFNITSSILDIAKLQYVPIEDRHETITLTITSGTVESEEPESNTIEIVLDGIAYLSSIGSGWSEMESSEIAEAIVESLRSDYVEADLPFTIVYTIGTSVIQFVFKDYLEKGTHDIDIDYSNDMDFTYTFTVVKGGTFDATPIDIEFIQAIPTLKVALKTNVYPSVGSDDTKPFSKSRARYATFILTLTILSTNNAFTRKIWGLMLKSEDVLNTTFKLNIEVDETLKITNGIFYLDNAPITKNIGEYPSITLTLTN